MDDKTTGSRFRKYGSVYEEFKEIDRENLISRKIVTNDTVISSLYNFSEPVYVELVEGMAYILIKIGRAHV